MKDFFGFLLNAVIWVIILVLLFLIGNGLYQHLRKDGVKSGLFGIGYAVVVSGSMEPAIKVNDIVIYQAKEDSDYRPGDVIIYEREENGESILISHRISRIDGGKIRTKGDANTTEDPWTVKYEDIEGRLVFRVPAIGAVVNFIRTPLGLTVAAIVIVLLILLNLILGRRRRQKRAVKTVMGEQYIKY